MQHIVQIAINFDDRRITEIVEETAAKEIIASLEQKVCDRVFNHGRYGGKASPKEGFSGWMDDQVKDFLERNKDEIVEMAGRLLADSLKRTKAVKEMVERAVNDEND